MKPEIYLSAIGSYTGGSHWKNAVFPAQLVVTATKDHDLIYGTYDTATLTAICVTPGVSCEWNLFGSLYDTGPVITAIIAGDYTVVVSKAGYINGEYTITVNQL